MDATTYTAIVIDEENGSEAWWDAVRETYPALADSLTRDRAAVIAAPLWDALAALPGFEDGPEFAPNPILDCGGEGEQWAHVTGGAHATFETTEEMASNA